ncbi:MAG: SDR family oxidoreductase [Spirochaetales bacterium]|jgi:NAD(P)-dependent dehydrogenase (short-subunit alcohol dehydrogenase family)|nr:SDR family oxidoreductase [Spirochaetales bacterium]
MTNASAHTLLITGANRGIGLEFVRQSLADGWQVIATCRHPDRANELMALHKAHPAQLSVQELDVTDTAAIVRLARELKDRPIDWLLSNAGVYGPKGAPFGSVRNEDWVPVFAANTMAPLQLMQAFVEQVAASKLKLMATISSKMGSMGDNTSGGSYIYRSTKAAVNAVVKSAAIDLAHRNITCVVLHPGWVQTEMGGPNAEITPAESASRMRAHLAAAQPTGRGRFIDIDGTTIPW